MQILNIDILNQNILKLMKEKELTQEQLGSAIGMSQSNFSRAINKKDAQCFTLEQVYNIALYFNVSVDYLLGNDQTNNSSEKEICTLFTSLLEKRKLVKIDTEREEEIFTPFTRYDGVPDTDVSKKKISYQAFVFPNYYDPGPLDRYTDDEIEDLRSDIYHGGNHDNSNKRINTFFEKYFQIYEMYLHDQITKGLFHEIINKFLDDLK